MKSRLVTLLAGLTLGFSLSRIGFSSWDDVHRMFVFSDLRLLLTFMLAVTLLVPVWWFLRHLEMAQWIHHSVHPGTLSGGIIFGIGWAVAGACPGVAFVQLGEGQLGAAWTIVGVVAGNWLYSFVHPRFFGWTTGSCIEDWAGPSRPGSRGPPTTRLHGFFGAQGPRRPPVG